MQTSRNSCVIGKKGERLTQLGGRSLAEVMLDTNETLQWVYEEDLLIQIRIHVIELVQSARKGRHWNTLSYFFLLLRLHPGVYVKLVAQKCMFNF